MVPLTSLHQPLRFVNNSIRVSSGKHGNIHVYNVIMVIMVVVVVVAVVALNVWTGVFGPLV
jgi:hypothetical protein